ncbi:protein TRANSPARENT TESTA 9-like isoform X1 [Syzygium oleosum]|uniref:protein TRANSPARENT TESTA 9-like isoform X1 n=2 Tax=Syzygium oleosum TaxID=219896 RepID=UPI0011D1EB7C|nr:protein TRANSPARENT TESTA 9-like isoform X1 [Syzygium oleosum]
MWRSLWRSIDRFSPQYFKYVINELRGIKVVDRSNREMVIDLMQSIVETVTYGDRHDPLIFEYFMEYQVMAEFVRVLRISKNSRIEATLLQYLSIMIQNIDSEHAIYYCFSNDYINNIIAHPYKFDGGDLAPYYISFLRAVSSKINRDTLCLLVKVDGDNVISFPLYSEALKFARHGEKMIQTAVRALSLNVYNVSDDMVFRFLTSPPVSDYFSDLVQSLKEQCIRLDTIVHANNETSPQGRIKEIQLDTDKVVDDLYYLKDIICIGELRLSRCVMENLLKLLVLPALIPLLQFEEKSDSIFSAVTSLYIVSRILQVVGGRSLINFIAGVILYPYLASSKEDASQVNNCDGTSGSDSFSRYMSKLEAVVYAEFDSEGTENINGDNSLGCLVGYKSCDSPSVSCNDYKICTKRNGILGYVFSDNPTLLLSSLYLLLILAESKDCDDFLSRTIRSIVLPKEKIVDVLLKVLANPQLTVLTYRQTGWFLEKWLGFQGMKLGNDCSMLFNTSYEKSRERLQKELDGPWFDYIPDTLRNEWESCKKDLEEPVNRKDPLFALELHIDLQKDDSCATTSSVSWLRMVDAVKAFVLHLQLKALIWKQDRPDKLVLDGETLSTSESWKTRSSDQSSANFGAEVALGSAFSCRIAFSNAGIRDIYVIPVSKGKTGKLLLMEKHPFRTQKGVVIAIAPLPGLSPKIDKEHPTWLHLQVREFDPRFDSSKTKSHHSKRSNNATDGRWTLGFPNAEACTAAQLMILEETRRQRSFVERQLALMLRDNALVD